MSLVRDQTKPCTICNKTMIRGGKAGNKVWQTKKFCSTSCLGKSKIGPANHKWKGDDVGYGGLHYWVYARLGKANNCISVTCRKTCMQYQWSNISGTYKRDLGDWQQLCIACHRQYDIGNKCRRGHEYVDGSFYKYVKEKSVSRICKICRQLNRERSKMNQKARRERKKLLASHI